MFMGRFMSPSPVTPTVPGHIMNVGRYGANRLWDAAYRLKQFGGRHPFMSLFALGTAPALMGTELDERRGAELAEEMKNLNPDWAANKGPMGIPVSSALGGLMSALSGKDMRSAPRDQLRGPPFDPWAAMRPQ